MLASEAALYQKSPQPLSSLGTVLLLNRKRKQGGKRGGMQRKLCNKVTESKNIKFRTESPAILYSFIHLATCPPAYLSSTSVSLSLFPLICYLSFINSFSIYIKSQSKRTTKQFTYKKKNSRFHLWKLLLSPNTPALAPTLPMDGQSLSPFFLSLSPHSAQPTCVGSTCSPAPNSLILHLLQCLPNF